MEATFESILLVLGRTSGIFLIAPVFSGRQIPVQIKVFLILILSGIIATVTNIKTTVPIDTSAYFIWAMVSEILVGYTIGFVTYLVFSAIQLAGQLLDMQMGFGIVNVLDPQSGMQVPLMGNFQYLIILMVFLGINGHHLIIRALNDSYQFVPVLGAHYQGNLISFLMSMAGSIFVVAVKLAAPVVSAVFMADVALGFVARTVPQMNVFIVGLPLKILGGLIMVVTVMPVFVWFMQILLGRFFADLDKIMLLMGK
ncbi:MAG: flagellar biosynthetic protein FliR [Candidatus Saccharibacteria bacterium]